MEHFLDNYSIMKGMYKADLVGNGIIFRGMGEAVDNCIVSDAVVVIQA